MTANVADFAATANDWRTAERTHSGLTYVANNAFPQTGPFIRDGTTLSLHYTNQGRSRNPHRDIPDKFEPINQPSIPLN